MGLWCRAMGSGRCRELSRCMHIVAVMEEVDSATTRG